MTIELVDNTGDEVEGYETLLSILMEAYDQAARGKGAQRHGSGLPFDLQPMQTISELLGTEKGMAFQAIKKLREGLELPSHDAKIRELLGTIVYVAGIILYLRNNQPVELSTFPEEPTSVFLKGTK